MDRRVTVFIDKAEQWPEELAALRTLLLDTGLTEAFKWRQPVYTYEGSNVVILWAFKDSCGLGFFKGVLLNDAQGLLEAPGPNTRASRKLVFKSAAEIEASADVIRDYVAEAIELEKAGRKVELPKDDLDYPEELVEALEADDALRAAFEDLTPGRQRGWVLHFSGAKKSETRAARIEKAVPTILKGKGMHDR